MQKVVNTKILKNNTFHQFRHSTTFGVAFHHPSGLTEYSFPPVNLLTFNPSVDFSCAETTPLSPHSHRGPFRHINPSSKSSLTIDDMILYPIQLSDPSESDHLSFVPEVRNDIFIQFSLAETHSFHKHYLHDIELLDEAGLVYMPHSASLSKLSN